MKKLCLIIMMILIIMIFTACGKDDRVPRISLVPSHWRTDSIHLPLREGYTFAEMPYTVEEGDGWYNVTVHCVKIEE